MLAICVHKAAMQITARLEKLVGARDLMPSIMIKGVVFVWSIKTDQKHLTALFYNYFAHGPYSISVNNLYGE
tara:strand:- start:3358 stop:3573 length:216 start_codon:yes stop_codon:yes gene_type:complete